MKNTGINPVVIKEIRQMAQQCGLARVILFGSRARGDFTKVSDIDLAVTGGNTARFALDIEETSTLLCFDVVDLDKPVQKELRKAIADEGNGRAGCVAACRCALVQLYGRRWHGNH